MTGTTSGDGAAQLDRLRAAVARIEGGGNPHPPPPPRSSPGSHQPGGDHPGDQSAGRKSEDAAAAPEARDPYAVARAIVLRQLSNAPKTRAQLAKKLAQRECPDEVATAVLDRMTEVGLVDDRAYAQLYVRSKQVTRSLSRQALAHELRRNGVADDIAAEVLDQVSPGEEEERARALVQRRLPRLHGMDRQAQVRRLAGLLARKGYPSGLAVKVVLDELDASEEHRRD